MAPDNTGIIKNLLHRVCPMTLIYCVLSCFPFGKDSQLSRKWPNKRHAYRFKKLTHQLLMDSNSKGNSLHPFLMRGRGVSPPPTDSSTPHVHVDQEKSASQTDLLTTEARRQRDPINLHLAYSNPPACPSLVH